MPTGILIDDRPAMLTCDRCDTPIPDDARFCPACGDPVTAADDPGARPTQQTERVRLDCPRCEQQSLFDIPAHGSAQEVCPACGAGFMTRVVRIRSKRSAGNKRQNTRSFTVRVEDLGGREDLIEFGRPSNEDFELKSRDLAAFSYLDGSLYVVQNLTVGRSMRIVLPPPPPPPPAPGCGGGAAATAVILLLMMGFCGVVFSGGDSAGRSSAPRSYRSEPTPAASTTYSEAAPGDLLYIHGALNVRTGPGKESRVIRTLSRGALVRLGAKDVNGWAPIYDAAGNREGYVFRASELVRTSAPAVASSRPLRSASSGRSSGSRQYHTGPRGGCYTYSASGRKRYVDRSYCN